MNPASSASAVPDRASGSVVAAIADRDRRGSVVAPVRDRVRPASVVAAVVDRGRRDAVVAAGRDRRRSEVPATGCADAARGRSTEAICVEHAGCLWHAFAAPLRSFLRARTRSAADAEDLLQEVFVRIQKRLPTLHDTSKIQGWVYRIARNVVIDHYRTRRDHVPIDFDLETDDPTGEAEVDLRPALRRFIAELPAHYREPLVRHEYQGESIEEVAAALGLSVTAAKSRVRRARLLLRAMLDRCCRFEFDSHGRVIDATPRNPCGCGAKR